VTRGVDARPVDARPSEAVLAELEGLCRRLRLRYIREQATEVLLTAKAQRWEPTELLRVLLLAEIDGRDASSTENRRKAARFPAGKTFDSWDPTRSSITPATQQALRSLEWVDRHENIAKAFTPILRADLVIVDDIGLLPSSADAAEGLYRLVDAAYERRSLAISTNLHPSGFDQLMDRTIATALVDRLLHHAHVIVTDGDSVRLADALAGKGVTPLT